MTILESMSIGLPTIVPNLGAIPELFGKDVKSKYLYTPRNLDMCCKLIIQNLNSNTCFDLSKYTPNKVLDIFLDILNKYIF
ncbi:glycosyl transferases group 1 family protein [[Clostridium] sordellii ATCC 9714]|nr:glycosyl transferases group 1 family protein [[Clostridium] sordellii ATCC 9714] [Paeniclostridium sordellii ATCC 9714]